MNQKKGLSEELDKFLGMKQLVDTQAIKKKDACEFLGITAVTYNRLSAKINALRDIKGELV